MTYTRAKRDNVHGLVVHIAAETNLQVTSKAK